MKLKTIDSSTLRYYIGHTSSVSNANEKFTVKDIKMMSCLQKIAISDRLDDNECINMAMYIVK